MTDKKRFTKDFETRSKINLKVEGAYKYSLDPSTQPTCLAFKILGEPTVYFLDFYLVNTPWKDLPEKLKRIWLRGVNEGFEFSAHNSFFERCIYDNILVKRYGWPKIDPRKRRCTAAKAASCALPRNLEGAGEAMKLRVQKDKRGYLAMMATCKPTKQWNAWNKLQQKIASGVKVTEKTRERAKLPEPPMFLEPLRMEKIRDVLKQGPQGPDDQMYKRAHTWNTLYVYCKFDVRSEEELDETLPDLIPAEQELWFLNQELNWRGLRVDIPTIQKVTDIMAVESKKKLVELDKVTMGLVTKPGARKSILEFLALEGIELPDIRANTVKDHLAGNELTETARRLLEIRKALSMTSTKKYQSFLNRAGRDGRVRDILMYHGASTGRDTGTGVQPHNFPRGLIKPDKGNPYSLVDDVVKWEPDMLRLLYGDTLPMLFSAILRNMIIPSEGHELFVADFSKIEVAVLWWLSDNWPGLEILHSGRDPYIYMAVENTGLKYDEIDVEGNDRQLGKAQVLGCGFGMGGTKFRTTAWEQYRLKLTLKQARSAVAVYRKANAAVPILWKDYETAAINCVKSGKRQKAGKCVFFLKDSFLWVELPSGRRLAYKDPQIAWRVREFDVIEEQEVNGEIIEITTKKYSQPMETLEFWAVNSKTKKWALERTWGATLTENIVQAVARDLMMGGILNCKKIQYQPLLMVHDEGICEKPVDTGDLSEFTKALCLRPPWADEHLPLEAKGWIGPRYRK